MEAQEKGPPQDWDSTECSSPSLNWASPNNLARDLNLVDNKPSLLHNRHQRRSHPRRLQGERHLKVGRDRS